MSDSTKNKNQVLMFDEPITDLLELTDPIADNRYFQNKYYDELEECYKVVEDFIKRNNRILVGGMAIDFSLKNKGSFLYKKNKIDYDFLSPDFHRDAYQLGEILAEKFGQISVIGAIHASTMRVRYKFMAVADITYMPNSFYEKMETINYMGFRCVHPHLQMIDQMRSIVYMAENPPRESFFGDRIVKDIKRFCMLAKFYPIVSDKSSKTLKTHNVPAKFLIGHCLGGVAAGAYWLNKLKIKTDLSFEIKDSINITIPENDKISIYSDKPDELIKLISDELSNGEPVKKYKAILDKLPERTIISHKDTTYEIIDSSTSLVLADKVNDFHIMHLYGVMMYLLILDAYIEPQHTLETFFNVVFKDFMDNVPALPREVLFYGTNNWSEPYLLSLKKGTPGFKPMLPRNAYPEKNKPVSPDAYAFDPTTSDILQKDGTERILLSNL